VSQATVVQLVRPVTVVLDLMVPTA
jgi:hypothetical protein